VEDAAMSDIDKIRANARHCLRNANDAPNDEIARTWLDMAETWLGMIPEAQRAAEEAFANYAMHQDASKSRH
jgi:hypothetical protein